ncbi:MAG: hypothetical protein LBJ15_19275 [Comamonas sp.]|uniref:hypothetical protein n=1 Tax=Comamonas sp. TaxID=34028 RepID=UPI0028387E57|nr:hypothetical protein [Comamonas sp.]MDR0216119.1 hypothetical protein [Comamonas sp.]
MTTEQNQIAELSAKIEILTGAVRALCNQAGARIGRQQLADRLGVHRNTVANMLERDRRMPRPSRDGKWLLADVIAWETSSQRR